MLKEGYLEQIRLHRDFDTLVQPLGQPEHIRDAEFVIRRDGILFNADGYAHPDEMVVGGALYTPTARGEKTFFGVNYSKTTLIPGTHEPIPYADRGRHFRLIDPELDQSHVNPFPFTYEHILPRAQFVGHIPAEQAFQCAVSGVLGNPEQLQRDIESLRSLLQIDLSEYVLGLTGAPALGQIEDYHDLDILFRGDTSQNRSLADAIRELLLEEPQRRLHEGGKSWLIRFYSDGEKGMRRTLFCCFFGYKDVQEAPLREFTMSVLVDDMELEGSVQDATHAIYTPSIVTLHDVIRLNIDGKDARGRLPDSLPLIIYHTGSRGELNRADRIWAHGALAQVVTPRETYHALVVIEREGVRNETPPWPDYYTRERI